MSTQRSAIDSHLEVLAELRPGNQSESERVIANHFLARARAKTRARIGPAYRAGADASAIANAALNSALKCARRQRVESGDATAAMTEETFAKRLGQIVARKVVDELRRLRAARRTSEREVARVSAQQVDDPLPGPDEVVAGRELLEKVLAAVTGRIQAEENTTDRLVLALGLLEGLSGPAINAALRERIENDPDGGLKPLSVRAIQKKLKSVYAKLRRELAPGPEVGRFRAVGRRDEGIQNCGARATG